MILQISKGQHDTVCVSNKHVRCGIASHTGQCMHFEFGWSSYMLLPEMIAIKLLA